MLQFSSQPRAETGVAVARLLVAVTLIAVGAGGSYTESVFGTVRLACIAYAVLAIGQLVYAVTRDLISRRLVVASHVIDFVFFSSLLLAQSPGSRPFLIFQLFPLAAAAVRFPARGFVATAAASIAVYATAGFIAISMGMEAGPVLLRLVVLLIVCGLMAHLRIGEEDLREHLASLALWKQQTSEELPIRPILTHAAAVFPGSRVLVAWEEADEPWLHIAWKHDEELRWVRESPTKFDPIVSPGLKDLTFLCRNLDGGESRLIVLEAGRAIERRTRPLHPALVSRFSIRRVLGVPIQGATFEGILLVLDSPQLSVDDLYLGKLVGEFLASRLDLHYLLERQAESAVAEERIRLSRDLHDGVLQSLTGASLQLEAIRRLVDVEPERAVERLAEIQQILASDQRELRAFIRQLRPSAGKHASDVRLRTRLSDLKNRFRRQWGLDVEIDTSGLGLTVLHGLRNEIYSVINEAVANAAKHAAASHVRIEVISEREAVRIVVGDDGTGFPFQGRYTLEELDRARLGPVTLKERIASLGGGLILESTPQGSRLEITIPLDWSEGSWLSAS